MRNREKRCSDLNAFLSYSQDIELLKVMSWQKFKPFSSLFDSTLMHKMMLMKKKTRFHDIKDITTIALVCDEHLNSPHQSCVVKNYTQAYTHNWGRLPNYPFEGSQINDLEDLSNWRWKSVILNSPTMMQFAAWNCAKIVLQMLQLKTPRETVIRVNFVVGSWTNKSIRWCRKGGLLY